jgi:hypothetical protein
MNKRQTIGLVGTAVLTLGVFVPLVSMPIVGSINYFNNGNGDGVIVLALAVVSALLILSKKYLLLWPIGLGSLVLVGSTFVGMSQRIAEMQLSLADNPFRGLATVQMQWGWAVLIIGAILLLVSAGMKDSAAVAAPPVQPQAV